MVGKPRQHVACITVVSAPLFSGGYSAYIIDSVSGADLHATAWVLLVAKTAVELIASAYGLAFLVGALAFIFIRDNAPRASRAHPQEPPLGIIYLCCDDADWSALESLTLLSYRGPLFLVIHDDSRDEQARERVDAMALHLSTMREWDVQVLRRSHKSGGKAGAVNYALNWTAHLYEYFLLCDNDSTVLQPDTIERALSHVEAKNVAGVQFRCVPVADPGYCGVNQRLAESIGAFHAFLAPAAQYGWMAVHRPQCAPADPILHPTGIRCERADTGTQLFQRVETVDGHRCESSQGSKRLRCHTA